jgi:hypothetical protein
MRPTRRSGQCRLSIVLLNDVGYERVDIPLLVGKNRCADFCRCSRGPLARNNRDAHGGNGWRGTEVPRSGRRLTAKLIRAVTLLITGGVTVMFFARAYL